MFEKVSAPIAAHDVGKVSLMANLSNVDKMRIATGKKRVESWDKYRKLPASNPVDKNGNPVQVRLRSVVMSSDPVRKPEVIHPDRVESNAVGYKVIKVKGKRKVVPVSLVKVSFGEREVLENGSKDLFNKSKDYDTREVTFTPIKHIGLEAEGAVVGGKGRDQKVYVPAGNGAKVPTKNPKSPFKRDRKAPVIVRK